MTNPRPRSTSSQGNPAFPPIRPPPSPFPLPSTPDLGCQSGGDEEISQGMKNNAARANWNHQRIVYLIELLEERDLPKFHTNNAWSKEVWKDITAQFNNFFSTLYSVVQVKQKEQDMKKEYRVVKDLSAESSFGWNSNRNMVTTPDSVWQSLEHAETKKPFFDGETSRFHTIKICLLCMMGDMLKEEAVMGWIITQIRPNNL